MSALPCSQQLRVCSPELMDTGRLFISNHNYAVFNQQSRGSFLTDLLDLTSKDRAKISCCFPKGIMTLFLLEA